jgi:hypothetical protein
MGAATTKAITMLFIALPTMFAVIAVFIAATKALHAAFPAEEEVEEDED